MNIELNNQQVYAAYDMKNWWTRGVEQLFQISGCAGTGKTTLVRYLIDMIRLPLEDVLFVAYMGKAAMQLARNGLPARTIHSAIYQLEERVAKDADGNFIFKANGKPKKEYRFVKREHIGRNIRLIVLDEGSMVNQPIGEDLLSFGIPIIVLGDLNQLPPVFGKPYFLTNPDVILTQIMRQAENNPIIWLAQQILAGRKLVPGMYGSSQVLTKHDLNEYMFKDSDIVLTATNALRHSINNLYREEIIGYSKLNMLNHGEKVICRRNNWQKSIDGNIFLMNGLSGVVDYIDPESYDGKKLLIDFRPDFLPKKRFKNITIDFKHLFENTMAGNVVEEDNFGSKFLDKFEFAYAITTHSSQGSQWNNIMYMSEDKGFSAEDKKKLDYTAVTRGIERARIVI